MGEVAEKTAEKTAGQTGWTDEQHQWAASFLGVDTKALVQRAKANSGGNAASGDADGGNAGGDAGGGGAKTASRSVPQDVGGGRAKTAPAGVAAAAPADDVSGGGSALPAGLPANQMDDEDIAAAIMDRHAKICDGWIGALMNFQILMTSSADAEATPDFQKAIGGYFADKLMGEIVKATPGGGELAAFGGVISAEAKRAAAAGASAKLRDFLGTHIKAVTAYKQAVDGSRQGFISAVKKKRQAFETARPAPKGNKKGGVVVESTPADDAYAMMRMELLDMYEAIDKMSNDATPQKLTRVLTEQWVASSKVGIGMGVTTSAVIVVRLSSDYSFLDAHIQGNGGQKLAEELLRDSPEGVDLLSMKAPKRILLMADNGWPQITLSLDASNSDKSTGSFGEGDTSKLYKYVMSKGLPLAKKITGD